MYHMLKLKYLHGCTFNKSTIFKYVEQNLPLGLSKSNNCSDCHLQTCNFQLLPTNLAKSNMPKCPVMKLEKSII